MDIPGAGNLSDFIPTAKRKIAEAQGKAKYFPQRNPNQANAHRGREYGEYIARDSNPKRIAEKFPDSVADSNRSVKNALKHPDKLGAGAAKRKKLSPSDTKKAVFAEYARGTLNSGSGHRAKSRSQAAAIAYSEARKK